MTVRMCVESMKVMLCFRPDRAHIYVQSSLIASILCLVSLPSYQSSYCRINAPRPSHCLVQDDLTH